VYNDVQVLLGLEFEPFFRAEYPRLVSVGLGLTGDREAAVDLAQEALLRCHRQWDRVSTLDSPGAWVRRVLLNLTTDLHRRRRREKAAIERLNPLTTVAFEDPAIDHWWTAVRELPERQRATVVLHYVGDYSVIEVGEILGMAEGTVKANLAKARANLARTLAPEVD
jgi:RNA polymerase sigma-70 factor, ECF subfamily